MAKKRNAQDATRQYDVRPLRARIVKLEAAVKKLQAAVRALEVVNANFQAHP